MLNNAIKIWKERNKILEGVRNSVFKKEHVEEIAAFRFSVCESCPLIDKEGSKCAVIGTQPCCSDCGCSLRLKTRSLSSECPKGLWKAVVSEQEEDLIKASINE